jgi:hypothetical protein
MVENYNKFRVDCEESSNSKCEQSPEEQKIIPEEIARSFADYAKLRGVSNYSANLDYYANLANLDSVSFDKEQYTKWQERNLFIDSKRRTIMNTNTVQPYSYYVEPTGKYAGYPTPALLQFLCLLYSPICVSELRKIAELLDANIDNLTKDEIIVKGGNVDLPKKYKLTKAGKLVQDL